MTAPTRPDSTVELDELISNFYGWAVGDETIGPEHMNATQFKARLQAILDREVAITEKAYGGCHNCYGKGYSTGAELYAAKGAKWGNHNKMKFCTCDRGQQLETQVAQLRSRLGQGEK
jgi:hypothetical protein